MSVPPAAPSPPTPAAPRTAARWSRYAGKLGAALTVTVSATAIRKSGYEPNEPDDQDVDLLCEALDEGLRLKFGDGDVPWWLGAALAAGGVYAGMRIGAKRLKPTPPATPPQIIPDPPATPAPTSPLNPSMFPPPVAPI